MIEAVIFDFGNVLARLNRLEICSRLGAVADLAAGEIERCVFGGLIEIESETGVLDEEGHREAVAQATGAGPRLTSTLFREAFWAGLTLHHERVSFLSYLREQGFLVGVLSNISQVHREWFVAQHELVRSADRTWYSCELGVMKPDVGAFRRVVDDTGLMPDQFLLVDDREENCVGARSCGMHSLHVPVRISSNRFAGLVDNHIRNTA